MVETRRSQGYDGAEPDVRPFAWPWTDPQRAFADVAAAATALPALTLAPRGRGETVLVLPGLGASDTSTGALRWFLATVGYRAIGWELGRNRGPSRPTLDGLDQRLRDVAANAGSPVHVVGWSIGGIYARWLAATYPGSVASVITLGTPHGLQRRFAPADADDGTGSPLSALLRFGRREPPASIPVTSIYSRSDGVVPWRASLVEPGERRENIEVLGSHFGYGFNPAVMWAIADRLAQRDGAWSPFALPGWPISRLFGSEVIEKSA
jgi:pimeloyl-ACP methyl ester carboxylesterase